MSSSPYFPTPEDAERAFYDAVARSDIDALMAIWSGDEETICIHPTGVCLRGQELIRESWRNIFSAARLRVSPEPVTQWQGMILAIHHLTETLFVGDDPAPHGPLHVTHVYSRGVLGWHLVSRHASAASDTPAAREDAPRVLH